MSNNLENQAFDMGREHGTNVGSWAIDGNTPDAEKRRIIQGYEEIMDMEPAPLSGEWADDPTPDTVLEDLGVDDDDHENAGRWDHLLTAYEQGFSAGYWDEVIRSAKAALPSEESE